MLVNVVSVERLSPVVRRGGQTLPFHAWLQFFAGAAEAAPLLRSQQSGAAVCDSPFTSRDYGSFVCVWRIYKLQFLVRETGRPSRSRQRCTAAAARAYCQRPRPEFGPAPLLTSTPSLWWYQISRVWSDSLRLCDGFGRKITKWKHMRSKTCQCHCRSYINLVCLVIFLHIEEVRSILWLCCHRSTFLFQNRSDAEAQRICVVSASMCYSVWLASRNHRKVVCKKVEISLAGTLKIKQSPTGWNVWNECFL